MSDQQPDRVTVYLAVDVEAEGWYTLQHREDGPYVVDPGRTFDHLGNRVDLADPVTPAAVAELLHRYLVDREDSYPMWRVAAVRPMEETTP